METSDQEEKATEEENQLKLYWFRLYIYNTYGLK